MLARAAAAGVMGLLAGGPALAGVSADATFIPHYRVTLNDSATDASTELEFGGPGAGARFERTPDDTSGWLVNAAYDRADGGDLAQFRGGLGRQVGGTRVRAALYAEYTRIDLEDAHVDGIGLQVRVGFTLADPLRLAVQLGHRCLGGDVRDPQGDKPFMLDLNEIGVATEYRLNPRVSAIADAQWTHEVVSEDFFVGANYHVGLRWHF